MINIINSIKTFLYGENSSRHYKEYVERDLTENQKAIYSEMLRDSGVRIKAELAYRTGNPVLSNQIYHAFLQAYMNGIEDTRYIPMFDKARLWDGCDYTQFELNVIGFTVIGEYVIDTDVLQHFMRDLI